MTGLISDRGIAVAVSVLFAAAVLAPVHRLRRAGARDSFPLSHYPMFSARRGAHLTVHHLQGVTASGAVRPLDSRLAATGGMNQERKQIARAARRGRGDRVARRVAARLARRGAAPDVICVQLVEGVFPLARAFEASVTADERIVIATALVPDRTPGPHEIAPESEGVAAGADR